MKIPEPVDKGVATNPRDGATMRYTSEAVGGAAVVSGASVAVGVAVGVVEGVDALPPPMHPTVKSAMDMASRARRTREAYAGWIQALLCSPLESCIDWPTWEARPNAQRWKG